MSRRASLKVVKRAGTETLYIRGTVAGRSVYESAGTADRALAEEKRAAMEAAIYREAIHGPAPSAAPEHTWSEALVGYLETAQRSRNTKSYLTKLHRYLGDATLASIDQLVVDAASKVILGPSATGATRLRQIVSPVRAVLRHAAARKLLASLPVLETPKSSPSRTDWLRPDQVVALIRAAAPGLRPMLAFAAATGARPAEYLDLDWSDIDLRGGRARLRLKGGKTRECDLPPVAVAALESLEHRDGAVFRTASGERYRDTERSSGGQFSTGWAGACQRAGLPGDVRVYARKDRARGPSYERFSPQHTPYVLRHSWASWHYAIHRDLKLLQRDGAWATADILEVYVHLMPPAYRQDAVDFLEGRVDLHFGAPGFDRRFRAVAVQLGRTSPLGRLPKALTR